jgi:hypothetical protein
MEDIYKEIKTSFSIKSRQERYHTKRKEKNENVSLYAKRLDYLSRKESGTIISSSPELSVCDKITALIKIEESKKQILLEQQSSHSKKRIKKLM